MINGTKLALLQEIKRYLSYYYYNLYKMNKLLITLTVLILLSGMSLCNAFPVVNGGTCYESSEILFSPQSKNRKTKIKKPMSVKKAQRLQAKKEKKLKRDSEKFIKENRKRSLEIQTPEVQKRMKDNIKDANNRYKDKRKNTTSRTKKAKKKYK